MPLQPRRRLYPSQLANRRKEIHRLHQPAAPARLGFGVLYHHHQMRHGLVELAQIAPWFALQAMIAKIMPMIRHQHHQRVFFEPGQFDRLKQPPQPAIDHRHLTRV